MRAPLTLLVTGVLSVTLAVGLLFWAQGSPSAVPPTEVVVGESPVDEPTPAPSPHGDIVTPPPPVTDGESEVAPERDGPESAESTPSPPAPGQNPTDEDDGDDDCEEDDQDDEDDEDDDCDEEDEEDEDDD